LTQDLHKEKQEKENVKEKEKEVCNNCIELENKLTTLVQQNKSLEQQLQDISQRNLYLMADFKNYKKQIDKSLQIEREHVNEKLLKDLLNIVDDLERAVSTIRNEENFKGVSLVYNSLMKILKEYQVKKIDCLGKQFDANLEEVLMQEESEKPEGTILEELQKGYTYKDRVLRYSKVKLAQKKKDIDEKKE